MCGFSSLGGKVPAMRGKAGDNGFYGSAVALVCFFGWLAASPDAQSFALAVLAGACLLVAALKWPVVRLGLAFLALWALGLEQYLAVPLLALFVLVRHRERTRRIGRLAGILGAVAALGLVAAIAARSSSVGIRTAAVWGGAALVVTAWGWGTVRGRRLLTGAMLAVWVGSAATYLLSTKVPGAAASLAAARRPIGGLATSPGFLSPTTFLNQDWQRPVGFLLYANELALFGLLIVPCAVLAGVVTRRSRAVALVTLTLVGTVLSSSRSIMVMTAAVLAIWLLTRIGARVLPGTVRVVLVAAVAACGLLTLSITDPAGHAFREATGTFLSAREGSSNADREMSYTIGAELFRTHPLFGIGDLPSLGPINAGSHSLPLSVAVRFGYVGLLFLAALAVLALTRGLRALMGQHEARSWAGAVSLVAIGASASIQFDDDAFSFAAFALLLAVLGTSGEDVVRNRRGRARVGDLRADVLEGSVTHG